jgi:transcriptional regulator with XRE-family HTH domain
MPASKTISSRVVDAHIGARLRQRRNELAISQKRLGEACGVIYQQIAKYECAVDCISAGRLYRIACFLKIPVAYFFQGLPGGTHTTNDATFAAASNSPETAELVAAYYRITDPKLRRAVVALIRAMSEAAH